jgi:hypothetical protein
MEAGTAFHKKKLRRSGIELVSLPESTAVDYRSLQRRLSFPRRRKSHA